MKSIKNQPSEEFKRGWNKAIKEMPEWQDISESPFSDTICAMLFEWPDGRLDICSDSYNHEEKRWNKEGWCGVKLLRWTYLQDLYDMILLDSFEFEDE
jgi:hypothetical protein